MNNCGVLLILRLLLSSLHWAISEMYLRLRNGVSGVTKSFITSQKQPRWIIDSRCSWFKLDTRVHFLSVLCKTTYYTSQAAAGYTGPAWIPTLLRCQCKNHTTHTKACLLFLSHTHQNWRIRRDYAAFFVLWCVLVYAFLNYILTVANQCTCTLYNL